MALISLGDAIEHVGEVCRSNEVLIAPGLVPLADAAGLFLSSPVVSVVAVPPFANTAMDGFVVHAADTVGASDEKPRTLEITGVVRAGDSPDEPLAPGKTMRIMTGAPLPPGADAVVMVERTRASGDVVEILTEVPPGNHVRPAGDDVSVGDVVFAAGERLDAGHLGVLASIGVHTVPAVRRLTVGVLSTGDELVPLGQPLEPGQIYDSNRLTLLTLVRDAGFDAVDLGLIRDDEDAIAEALTAGAARCDALLTSGGVSMGDFDFVKVVLDRIGVMRWMQVAIKPAKPFAFGTIPKGDDSTRRVPVFGLPGNPVSSMVSFEVLARPALLRLAGAPFASSVRLRVEAIADHDFVRAPDGKTHFVRVVADFRDGRAGVRVRSAGAQGSHQLSAMARANALAELPDGHGVKEHEPMLVHLLRS